MKEDENEREREREDVKMRRCERRCEDEKGVREDVKIRRYVKMRRCERRCEDEKVWEKMWRWEGGREDVKMRRWERRCEDEKVWEKMCRWEDEIQTPIIGKTLRLDALGNKNLLPKYQYLSFLLSFYHPPTITSTYHYLPLPTTTIHKYLLYFVIFFHNFIYHYMPISPILYL